MRGKTMLVAILLCNSANVLADAKGLAWVCAGGLNPENGSKTMMLSICRSTLDGFINGINASMGRFETIPIKNKRCAPDPDNFEELDAIAAAYVAHLLKHPELDKAPYGQPLKNVIDQKYRCRNS